VVADRTALNAVRAEAGRGKPACLHKGSKAPAAPVRKQHETIVEPIEVLIA
jgi:hypothetical protein